MMHAAAIVQIIHLADVYNAANLARAATIIEQLRTPATIVTLGGDTISPSPDRGTRMIQRWNAIGIDVAVLGNHEFDYGHGVLDERLAESAFIWLGTNVAGMPSSFIHQTGVGFLGFITPDTATLGAAADGNVTFMEPCEVVAAAAADLRARGAWAVIGLTHLTLAQDYALACCSRDALDYILGGHDHGATHEAACGIEIAKPPSDATHIGVLEYWAQNKSESESKWRWHQVPVLRDTPSHDLVDPTEAARDDDDVELMLLREPLSFRTLECRTGPTSGASMIAEVFRRAARTDIGFVVGGAIRGDFVFEYGHALTRGDIRKILPFGNELVIVTANSHTIRQALKHAFAGGAAGAENTRYPHIVGFDDLDTDKSYTVALTDYIARGGEGFNMWDQSTMRRLDLVDAEAVIRHIVA